MKSLTLIFLSVFCAIILSHAYAPSVESVPAAPGVHSRVQSNGMVVYYELKGDEFLNYMVDVNGNLVSFGSDGDLYYANWADEIDSSSNLVLTNRKVEGVSPSIQPPSERDMHPLQVPIPEHIVERAENRRAERDASWREQFSSPSPSPSPLPTSPSQPPSSSGGYIVMTIFALAILTVFLLLFINKKLTKS